MNVIDLFSGAGGFSTGLEQCGFEIVLANELDPSISHTYKKNHPKTLMINLDINKFVNQIDDNIDLYLNESGLDASTVKRKLANIDLVVGGPPCQGFSMAGERIRKSKSFLDDPRNFLFNSYFKVIQKFEPEYFLFENVVGLLSMKSGDILKQIELLFSEKSNFKRGRYFLTIKVFDASEYGVPQQRKRVIILGSKKPVEFDELIKRTLSNLDPELKKRFTNKVSLSDAIYDLNYLESGQGDMIQEYTTTVTSNYQKAMRGNSKKLFNHVAPKHTDLALTRIKQIKENQNWKNLIEHESIKSVHSGAYGRLSWDKPTKTITTRFDTPSGGRFIHPEKDRTLTPREAARIQSFPDDFVFLGSKSSICKQIGNAVPPLLAEFLGLIIRNIK
ncbi:DNA cytosine methyltransferase [Psychrosphaera sp. F3M07]|uniref:DNA cytosine methyltransferase n=1 Tax=Psychrosphaera sp. F3M07 TaxID=2841560 RepID=UPI001C09A50F|nr:DNA cytosine methyltransferase [Psychrosphaera sp. F3M07]